MLLLLLSTLTQHGEDASKRGGWRPCLNSHRNYIVDHGKSWKNHGIVFLNICGNPQVLSSSSYFIETMRLLKIPENPIETSISIS